MPIFRRPRPADAAALAEPPESISPKDWEKLKAGALVEIQEFKGQLASAQKLADVLETNTTLAALGTHLFSSNADESLSDAIVRSRNPNFVHSNMDGIGGASEIVLPVEPPPAVKRLNALRDYNHARASALLDAMQGDPAALKDADVQQAQLRKPAITYIAARERGLSEPEIAALFEKLPPTAALDPKAPPPPDAGLEAALAPLADPPAPSKLRQIVDGARFAGLMAYGTAASIVQERRLKRESERRGDTSPGTNERS